MFPPPSGGTYPDGPHICSHCGKEFRRACDLNKHAKCHNRPFKCRFPGCKYGELGWPTTNELDRHVNDKHSPTPHTYPCLFPSCSYKSKRESNCKQHMEKAHDWKYVRSKAAGKQRTAAASVDSDHEWYPPSGSIPIATSPTQDIQLPSTPYRNETNRPLSFPDGLTTTPLRIGMDIGEYDRPIVSPDVWARQDIETYIPWPSPLTRLRENVTFLQRFARTYSPSEQPAPDYLSIIAPSAIGTNPDCLSEAIALHTPQTSPLESNDLATSEADTPLDNEACGLHCLYSSPLPSPAACHFQLPITPTQQAGLAPNLSKPQYQGVSGHNQASSSQPTRRHNLRSHPPPPAPGSDDEGDDHDDDRPRKRIKPMPTDDFKDSEMPDIFHVAHSHIYNRSNKTLYGSCHSTHKDISTLVRHLGRAPHRLSVTEKSISSFQVADDEYGHVKVGLCRRCWSSFHDPGDFTSHLEASCDKVSKGKREKWQILYDTFTPLLATTTTRATEASHGTTRDPSASVGHSQTPPTIRLSSLLPPISIPEAPPESAGAPRSTPTSALTPSLDPGLRSLQQYEGQLVPMDEHRRVCEEVQVLKLLLIILIAQGGSHGLPSQYPRAISASQAPNLQPITSPAGVPHVLHHVDTGVSIPQVSSDDAMERESLVGHMDSQSTNVDRQGLMDEVETLSRSNSGLSSDKSTVHHIPNSPPTRSQAYAAETNTSATTNPSRSRASGSTQPHHQPTSIADSGYESIQRKNQGSIQVMARIEETENMLLAASGGTAPDPMPVSNQGVSMSEGPTAHVQRLRPDVMQRTVSADAATGPDPPMPLPSWTSESSGPMMAWEPDPLGPSDSSYSSNYGPDPFYTDGSGADEFQLQTPLNLDSQEFRSEDG